MARLRPLPFRKVDRALRRLGFVPVRTRGSHVQYRHPDGRLTTVPAHAAKDVSVGLLRSLLRFLDLSVDEFERLD